MNNDRYQAAKNKVYELQIRCLSPLHIGNGQFLKPPFDYIHFPQEQKLGLVDLNKLAEALGIYRLAEVNDLVNVIDQGAGALSQFLKQRDVFNSSRICSRQIDLPDNIRDLDYRPSRNELKEQLHLLHFGQLFPALPGSSLKGSLRTALFATAILNEEVDLFNNGGLLKNRRGRMSDRQLQEKIFGKDPNNDLLRLLQVGDAMFKTNTTVIKSRIINLYRDKWGEKFRQSSFWEVVPTASRARVEIRIPSSLVKAIQNMRTPIMKASKIRLLQDHQALCLLINKHTLRLVQNELDFWDAEGNPLPIGDYMPALEKIEQTLLDLIDQQASSCILRVGAGAGWESMTGGWAAAYTKNDEEVLSQRDWLAVKRNSRRGRYPDELLFPKTRKLNENGIPTGFLELNWELKR
ncbi:type III-A CRISPR-associated RAMP protein Csm5 [Saprospira sp. CCB-QB6]|uniref:type III-A CRISPR-associated RAMP protein Csm5 n=1 Tax=Saprospira sp. CCB-QB6 TaxID=3023936 RepID=UPI00234ADBF2|nr:type III-A CRISPR-associated RAMP protein Csm5 [Saprospira sp. CCB-QB6]WCL81675.1 type III-A CRISPR-associated RAMP protein Csm5 [Saprospira sp. CCB-QB6]